MLHLSRRRWQRTPKTDFCACWHQKQHSWDTWDTFSKPLRIRKKEIFHYAKDFQNSVPSVPTSPLRSARNRDRHNHSTNQSPIIPTYQNLIITPKDHNETKSKNTVFETKALSYLGSFTKNNRAELRKLPHQVIDRGRRMSQARLYQLDDVLGLLRARSQKWKQELLALKKLDKAR